VAGERIRLPDGGSACHAAAGERRKEDNCRKRERSIERLSPRHRETFDWWGGTWRGIVMNETKTELKTSCKTRKIKSDGEGELRSVQFISFPYGIQRQIEKRRASGSTRTKERVRRKENRLSATSESLVKKKRDDESEFPILKVNGRTRVGKRGISRGKGSLGLHIPGRKDAIRRKRGNIEGTDKCARWRKKTREKKVTSQPQVCSRPFWQNQWRSS